MKNILEEIVTCKKREVLELPPYPVLVEQALEVKTRKVERSIVKSLRSKPGIIAEFKRRSPSRGVLCKSVNIQQVVGSYVGGEASAISVLTDAQYFGAMERDFADFRESTDLPLLRKDFIVSEQQVAQTAIMGADIMLLIVAILEKEQLAYYIDIAKKLGLECLVEIHNEDEALLALDSGAEMIGVNARNLKTFETNLDVPERVSAMMPKEVVLIAESGIKSPKDIKRLRNCGYRGFLVGESLMTAENPRLTLEGLVNAL